SALFLALMPTSVGYQDLAALLAQRPSLSQSFRDHMIASPFGTIEPATFSYGRPIGTSIPAPLGYQTVNFDPDSVAANGWRIDAPLNAATPTVAPLDYPTVNRRLKGDRQPVTIPAPASAAPEPLPQLQPVDAPPAQSQPVAPTPSPPPMLHLKSA